MISPISALGTKIRLAELEGDDKNSPVNSESGKGGVSSEEVKLEIPYELDIIFLDLDSVPRSVHTETSIKQ